MFRQRMPNSPSQVLSLFRFDCVYLVNNVKASPAQTHFFMFYVSWNIQKFAKFESLGEPAAIAGD